MDNILSIDGYEDGSHEVIDISGTLAVDKKMVKMMIQEQMPWSEKYRPTSIEDIIVDNSVLNRIKQMIKEKDMPNIIITGVPGIGKTTTIKCIARGLYGKHINHAVIEMNASDHRGIKTVDENITNFCKKSFKLDDRYAKHKLIILDEADNITLKAQYSINKKMEEYGGTTRFAFTCNKSSDILEAIQSRCIILRYVRLPLDKIIERLEYICNNEKIEYTKDALINIATISLGDLRTSINKLQAVYNGMNKITTANVFIICDEPQPVILQNLIKMCREKEINKAFSNLLSLEKMGYSNLDIATGIINVLKIDDTIEESEKIFLMNKMCNTSIHITRGVNTRLQLYGLISAIITGYTNNENKNITQL